MKTKSNMTDKNKEKKISEWITLGLPLGIIILGFIYLMSKIPVPTITYETRYCIDRRIAIDDCDSKTFEEARIKAPNSRIYIFENYIK